MRPFGPIPVPLRVHPERWPLRFPGSGPGVFESPRKGTVDPVAVRVHDPYGSLVWAAAPALTGTGAGFLDLSPVAGADTRCGLRKEEWFMPCPFGCGAIPPGIAPRLLDSAGPPLSRVPAAGCPPIAAFAATGRGIAATAGFRRRADPSRRPPRFDPEQEVQLPTSRSTLLLSGRERSTQDCFRFPVARALRPPVLADRPYRRTRPPEGLRLHSERIAPLLRKGEPFLGRGPLPNATLAGNDGAGDPPRLSSLEFFPFGVSSRLPLSGSPAGPLAGDFRTFIDLRSELSRQPNVSVRVASR